MTPSLDATDTRTVAALTPATLRGWGYYPIPSGGGPSGKAPVVRWAPFQRRRATDAELAAWKRELTPRVWGIVTGRLSGVVVIDCDAPEAKAIMGDLEPHVETPRGGCHFYFMHPHRPVNTVAGVLPGLDIRGDGGFVNIIGAGYRILRPPAPEHLYPWERLPESVRRALETPTPAPMPATAGTGVIPEGAAERSSYHPRRGHAQAWGNRGGDTGSPE